MYSVTVEENSIQRATFDSNGEYVFTGTNNTLRVIFSYDEKVI